MCDSGTDEQKIKVVQLYMDGVPGYVIPIASAGACLQAEIESLDVGEGLELKVREFTQQQLDNAPEFQGW